ncbi:LMWPc-domain-containing protein [Mollisia scopiformis]|uniref:LMWPc-domain-containing protein n=1 Tax=Mollisia scopiformis TaxID=149040 RepID=A0A194WW44_MOLSC|nr:LMWPc-domain-containing protein [Mollisia scopiformis]KUJ11807.1 LMWPc-domain-containing protein [Mollisia scopiformis]
MTTPSESIAVLFVCLGNICRSTMAEGIFRSMASKPPYNVLISSVDSCGTGAYHTGSSPDSRTMSTLEDNGITDYSHAARKVHTSDFQKFDYIFAMDRDNLRDLQRLQQRADGKAKVMLFGEFGGKKRAEEVEDPYYGGRDGFEVAYEQIVRFSKNFLKETFEVGPKVEQSSHFF